MIFLGIDPGTSGGMAALYGGCISFISMSSEGAIWQWIKGTVDSSDQGCRAVIEQVSGYIGQAQPGSAAFKFGQSYGGLRMALIAAGFRDGETFFAVRPQEWQRTLGIPHRKKTENKSQWKGRLKEEAEKRFPSLKITLATADALLLAYYCRQTYGDNNANSV